jgi:hypothetical protein
MSHSNNKKFAWVDGIGVNLQLESCSPTAEYLIISIHTGDSFALVLNPTAMLDTVQQKSIINEISCRILKMYDRSEKGGGKNS